MRTEPLCDVDDVRYCRRDRHETGICAESLHPTHDDLKDGAAIRADRMNFVDAGEVNDPLLVRLVQLRAEGTGSATHQNRRSCPSVVQWSCHLRVMASHFSGVVTMIRAFATSRQAPFEMSESPVSSWTVQPNPCSNFFFQSATRSEHSDFVGACGQVPVWDEREGDGNARPKGGKGAHHVQDFALARRRIREDAEDCELEEDL